MGVVSMALWHWHSLVMKRSFVHVFPSSKAHTEARAMKSEMASFVMNFLLKVFVATATATEENRAARRRGVQRFRRGRRTFSAEMKTSNGMGPHLWEKYARLVRRGLGNREGGGGRKRMQAPGSHRSALARMQQPQHQCGLDGVSRLRVLPSLSNNRIRFTVPYLGVIGAVAAENEPAVQSHHGKKRCLASLFQKKRRRRHRGRVQRKICGPGMNLSRLRRRVRLKGLSRPPTGSGAKKSLGRQISGVFEAVRRGRRRA